MENGYSVIMLIFSGALLFYAGLMALTKDYTLLPLRVRRAVKPKNRKQYMVMLAKIVAIVAAAPALSAFVGFWNIWVALVVLVAGTAAAIWLGIRLTKHEEGGTQ